MNVSEMMDELGLRLEDAAKAKFTDAWKILALDKGQTKVANMIHPGYLTELEYLKETVTLTSGKIALTAANLTYELLRGKAGIIQIKVNGTSGLICTPTDVKDRKKMENSYLQGTAQNPLFYVLQNTLYVYPTSTAAVDISFLKVPTTLRYKFTADQADSGASTTKFDGLTGEGLSTTNDAYNGAVVYSLQYNTYHVVTDYVGADLEFTVSPAAGGNFLESQEFYFITQPFDLLTLTGVDCELNESLHSLVVDYAEAVCWGMSGDLERKSSVQKAFYEEIGMLNAAYENPTGIGTNGNKGGK